MTQEARTTFTMPNGTQSPPVITTRNEGESLADFLDRHKNAVEEAILEAWT